jgi:nitrogen regulatory protein PII
MDKTKEQAGGRPLQMITLILNEQQCHRFDRLAKAQGVYGGIVVFGRGTVKSATLNLLGIKSQKKEIVHFLIEEERAKETLDLIARELRLVEAGHGIAFATRVIGAGRILGSEGKWNAVQDMEGESMYKKLTVVVNRGMAEAVMDIARKSGVKGGTVIHGRGTGSEATAKLFGIEIQPEKELVIILMPGDLVEKVVSDLYHELQMDVPGNGILFVEPIVAVRGLVDSHDSNKNA